MTNIQSPCSFVSLILVALAATACADVRVPQLPGTGPVVSTQPQREAWVSAQQRWADANIQNYTARTSNLCFHCSQFDGRNVHVTVVSGALVSVSAQPLDGEGYSISIDPADYEDWYTVDDLFALIDRALDDAYELEVTYDDVTGVPTSVYVDWYELGLDDEDTYIVEGFTVTGTAPAE